MTEDRSNRGNLQRIASAVNPRTAEEVLRSMSAVSLAMRDQLAAARLLYSQSNNVLGQQLRLLREQFDRGSEFKRVIKERERLIASFARPAIPPSLEIGSSLKAARLAIETFQSNMTGATAALAHFQKATQPDLINHLRRLNEPYAQLKAELLKANRYAALAGLQVAQAIKGLNFPIIELETAAALASQLDSEGVAQMVAFVESATSHRSKDNSDPEVSGSTRISSQMYWNLFNVLLTLLLALYAEMSSRAMEDRLTNEVRGLEWSNIELSQSVRKVEEMLLDLLQDSEAVNSPEPGCLIAKSRPAIAREAVEGAQIGTVFPNQLVREVGGRGKWVRVFYYDLAAQEDREGWVLKKYFSRVPYCAI